MMYSGPTSKTTGTRADSQKSTIVGENSMANEECHHPQMKTPIEWVLILCVSLSPLQTLGSFDLGFKKWQGADGSHKETGKLTWLIQHVVGVGHHNIHLILEITTPPPSSF